MSNHESGKHLGCHILQLSVYAAIFTTDAKTVEDSCKWTSFKYKNRITLLLGYLL